MKINASKQLIYSLLIINFKSMGQKVNNFSDFPWKSSKVNVMSQMLDLDSLKFNSEEDDFVV